MSESVTLKSYFYEVLIPSSQKNTSSPIEDILHHVSISFMKKLALYKCFNPRTHMGCDALVYRPVKLIVLVSIHAPTRGATNTFQSRVHICVVSIHAPTRGATQGYAVKLVLGWRFQSTHPHGVRQPAPSAFLAWSMFQSTHPHGVRLFTHLFFYRLYKFQSTHPHGVRPLYFSNIFRKSSRFNPRTHTGCDSI